MQADIGFLKKSVNQILLSIRYISQNLLIFYPQFNINDKIGCIKEYNTKQVTFYKQSIKHL